jgi:hypothetical protein
MTTTRPTPCGNLLFITDTQRPGCLLDHAFPDACPTCADYVPGLSAAERTRCEVWTRVMGYHRPVSQWNAGKQQEHRERVVFREAPTSLLGDDGPADRGAA